VHPAARRRALAPASRREFLRGGAAALVGGALGCAEGPPRGAAPPYDVCVVGSGFAGLFLGQRLVDGGARTIILEAGPHLPGAGSPEGAIALFPWRSVGPVDFPLDETRTIGVGGTSRRWNGVATRLAPADFRTRTEFGLDADWPLAYDDLASYYCQAEEALGVTGGATVPGAEPPRSCPLPFEASGYVSPAPLFEPLPLAFFPLPFSSRGGARQPLRLADVEVPRFVGSAGATLLADSPAARLVTEDGVDIDSCEIRRADGSREAVRARCFVVAAGVVESARLLLASTSRFFPRGLGNRAGLVGTRFNAHPRYRRTLPPDGALGAPRGIHRSYSATEALRRQGLGAALFDVHLQAQTVVDLMTEMEPAPANTVTLEGAAGGPSVASLHVEWSERDRGTLAQGLALHDEVTRAVAPPGPLVPPALRWFHPAGACGMGADEGSGVVDRDGRVFGLRNLYLAGASTFTTSGPGNPTLTVVALALRLADHLLGRLG